MVSYFEGRIARGEIGRSALTNQRAAVRGFVLSFGARPLNQLGEPAVLRWLETLKPYKLSTRRMYVSAVRGWFRYLHEVHGLADLRPFLPKYKPPRNAPRSLSRSDVARMLVSIPTEDTRARAMLALEVYLGLRNIEISRLKAEDYDGNNLFVVGKGGHERIIRNFGGTPAARALDAWLVDRGAQTGPLFPGQDPAKGLNPAHISRMITGWMLSAGVKHKPGDGRSAHSNRHTALTHAYEATGDIRVVQELAGHSNLGVTSAYVRLVNTDEMRRAVDRDYFAEGTGTL